MTQKAGRAFLTVLLVALLCRAAAGQDGGGAQAAGAPRAREVAVTFDDLPTPYGDLEDMRRITANLLPKVKRAGVPAVGFVNEGRLFQGRGEVDERRAVLEMWPEAGFELGNHTFSHINMNRAPLSDYRDDIVRGETLTRMMLREKGMTLRYFRHPYLRTGVNEEYKRGLEEFLKGRGYTVAPVTIDNADYIFADVYFKAKKRGDAETARRVADAYVPYMEGMFDYFERLAGRVAGREIKHVLLLHANELNADHFDALAAMMKRRGYAFVTLEEALKDEVYRLPDPQTKDGVSWLHRWRVPKGVKADPEPTEPAWLRALYEAGRRLP
jgi:peptidoglycan/xylan/chitin deacetylase (PgdA/CDA1 family)